MLSHPRIDPIIAIDNLLNILAEFEGEEDRLSKRILVWSARLFEAMHAQTDIAPIAQKQLHILTKSILVNPIDNAPLQEPIVERSVIWEKWMHQAYRVSLVCSPFDQQPFQENPPPHHFACAMLLWAKEFEAFIPKPQLSLARLHQGELALVASSLQLEAPRLLTRLAQVAYVKELNRQLREDMEWGLVEADAKVAKLQGMSQLVLEKATKEANQDLLAIRQQIEDIELLHGEALASLHSQMGWREKVHQDNVSALEQRIAGLDQTNTAVIGGLKNQVQALNRDYNNAVLALENKMQALSKAHAAAMASLEGQLTRIRADHSAAQSAIAGLQHSAAEINAKLRNANAGLQKAQLELQAQQRENQLLNNACQYAQGEIRRLRNEINEMDDTFCSIM